MHQHIQSHRAMATIATLLFSMSGLAQIRSIAKTRAPQPVISDPAREARVERILAAASRERQAKRARRAARYRFHNE